MSQSPGGGLPALVTIAAAPFAPVSAATARRALLARTGFVDRERPTLEGLFMEHLDRLGNIFRRRHFDEGETAGSPRRAVLHDVNGDHRAGLGEVVLQVIFRGVEGKVTDEQSGGHISFWLCFAAQTP